MVTNWIYLLIVKNTNFLSSLFHSELFDTFKDINIDLVKNIT